jgi:hypothetical protein
MTEREGVRNLASVAPASSAEMKNGEFMKTSLNKKEHFL